METTIWIQGMHKKSKTVTAYLLRKTRVEGQPGEHWVFELVENGKPKLVTLTYDGCDEEKLARKKRHKDFIDVAISRGKVHAIIGEHRDEGWQPHIAIPKKSLIPYPLQDNDEAEGWVE